jgi:hypothetical protein
LADETTGDGPPMNCVFPVLPVPEKPAGWLR